MTTGKVPDASGAAAAPMLRRTKNLQTYTIRARELDRSAIERFFGSLRGLVGVTEEPDAITFSFERVIPWLGGGVWPEQLSFDPAALAPGTYTLQVGITDHNLFDRRVETSQTFRIVD